MRQGLWTPHRRPSLITDGALCEAILKEEKEKRASRRSGSELGARVGSRQVGGVGGGLRFSPLSIGGLIGWYDTSVTASLTFASGFVSAIADQSGAGSNMSSQTTTTTYSATGFNTSYPALVFEVSVRAGYFTCSSFPMGTGPTLTAWYVGNLIDNGSPFLSSGRALGYKKPGANDYDNVGSWCLVRGGNNSTSQFARNSTGSNATATLTSPHRIIVTVNSSGDEVTYVNGTPTNGTTVAGNWVDAGTMFLGSNGVPAQNGYWNGPISEWGISTNFTGSTNVGALDTYLKNKWGM